MKVSNVKINWKNPDNSQPTQAFGSALIADVIAVDFRVMKSSKGLWVALPSEKGKDGKYRDKIRFLKKEDTETFKNTIISAFNGDQTNEPQSECVNEEDIPF